ncbi:MAG: transketolase C-terminal domain-containing protein, partial [Planctomycetota bacterium]
KQNGRVVAFLEPIALYHTKELYEEGDGRWLSDYPTPGETILPGEVGLYGEGDLLIISYANGVRMSLRATQRAGIAARVLDLRWLAPLPSEAIEREAATAKAILVVDECRATGGGVADAVIAHLAEQGLAGRVRSVRAADSFIPIGAAADTVLVSEAEIEQAARELIA